MSVVLEKSELVKGAVIPVESGALIIKVSDSKIEVLRRGIPGDDRIHNQDYSLIKDTKSDKVLIVQSTESISYPYEMKYREYDFRLKKAGL